MTQVIRSLEVSPATAAPGCTLARPGRAVSLSLLPLLDGPLALVAGGLLR